MSKCMLTHFFRVFVFNFFFLINAFFYDYIRGFRINATHFFSSKKVIFFLIDHNTSIQINAILSVFTIYKALDPDFTL